MKAPEVEELLKAKNLTPEGNKEKNIEALLKAEFPEA